MKISNSTIHLDAKHETAAWSRSSQTLRAWVGDAASAPSSRRNLLVDGTSSALSVATISLTAQALAARAQAEGGAKPSPAAALVADASSATGAARAAASEQASDDGIEPRLRMLVSLIERLTGRPVRVFSAESLRDPRAADPVTTSQTPAATASANPAAPPPAGWGMTYDRHDIHVETEQTEFSAQGVVRTADGREIRFDLTLLMQRQYVEESRVSLRAGDALRPVDPLILNFDGTAAQLQSQRFSFDLDGDGQTEELPLPGSNFGYLALDLDGNGQIDDGRELFGMRSGDGFADLARYDDDGNGWIDENDAVFERLRVWTPGLDTAGDFSPRLDTLAARQVGALYLGKAETPFEVRDAKQETLGQLRSTGLYLRDDGGAGTMQHLDLMV
ncbi:hypothetical protein DW355_03335 [Hylemonella gracilis]|uniref:VCBS repeat-containing protein n=1 Tax=Hylemonella gracilis TaxID=80880 RepID=A0A4P6UIP0_9BURK|nr:hypothetical protein [Hylemonella gracilis]QBK03937.1 hypothetical protein DW355_03335 [Hylemonella gracilis]